MNDKEETERWSGKEGHLLSRDTGGEVFMAYVGWDSQRLVPTSIRPEEVAFAYLDTRGSRKCVHYQMSNGITIIRPIEE